MSEKLIITPKTKVLQVIEAYPELEDVLIGYVPAFKKLKNPILRNTVAKIATLQQAASVGKVKIEDFKHVPGNWQEISIAELPGWNLKEIFPNNIE